MNRAEIARRLRERFDTVLVRTGNSGQGITMHVPDEDGELLCKHVDAPSNSEPVAKDVAVYPPGWASWCVRCASQVVGDPELYGDIRQPAAATDGGERV